MSLKISHNYWHKRKHQVSYSFTIIANSKAEVPALLDAEFDKVVEAQPIHEKDREAAKACGLSMLNLVRDCGEGEVLHVSGHGSLVWQTHDETITTANVGASVSIRQK